MTVRANKPFFNIREKIKELDFFRLPYQKMPPGSIVQIATATTTAARQTIASTNTIPQPIAGLSIDFTPRLADSKILITTNIATNRPYVSSFAIYEDGSPTVDIGSESNLSTTDSNLTLYNGNGTSTTSHMYMVPFQVVVPAHGTYTRTYDSRAISRWQSTSYTLYINNRAQNDMASFSTMIVYEIAQ